MKGAGLEHIYRYAGGSRVAEREVALATSGGEPALYAGWVDAAPVHAQALLAVARAARSRFHDPAARPVLVTDPVVTVDAEALRFEAFSSCCGVYARHDVRAPGLAGARPGTTNVDFNEPMRAALAGVAAGGSLHLTVGREHVMALTGEGAVVERRVELPLRWIRGFGEVGLAQAAMAPRLDLPGAALRRVLRELPRSGTASDRVGLRQSGRELRLSRTGGVPVAGPQRLLLLEPLAGSARRLRVFASDGGASAWVLDLPGGTFTLALSPEAWRGFSGEGGALRELAAGAPAGAAARGFAGYDLAAGAFFARTLPFDVDAVEALHPRLQAARRLVEAGAVRRGEDGDAFVRSGATDYHVRVTDAGARCSCPWFARHRGERGPCKHVLAAELVLDGVVAR